MSGNYSFSILRNYMLTVSFMDIPKDHMQYVELALLVILTRLGYIHGAGLY